MRDPYSLLGIDRTATDEEVKDAYRKMARKYHPDNFNDNPAATELATEKMQEINEAYDEIMNSRKNGGKKKNSSGFGGYSENSNFKDVRELISAGRFEDAQEILDGVPPESRDAEWYFLNGTVLYRRGWFDAAYTSLATACRMDPTNDEYRAALNHMQRSRNGYSSYGNGGGTVATCTPCDCCAGLMCMDMCCRCI